MYQCVCVSVGMGTFSLFNSFVGLQLFFSFLSVFNVYPQSRSLFSLRCGVDFLLLLLVLLLLLFSQRRQPARIFLWKEKHTLLLALSLNWLANIIFTMLQRMKKKREWVKNKLKCFDWRYCERVCESCFVYGRIECLRWDKGFL